MYALGIIFAEMWRPFATLMERAVFLSELRKTGKLPEPSGLPCEVLRAAAPCMTRLDRHLTTRLLTPRRRRIRSALTAFAAWWSGCCTARPTCARRPASFSRSARGCV
jgi:hypothetical protein